MAVREPVLVSLETAAYRNGAWSTERATSSVGVSGLYGLTGVVDANGNVGLFATSYTLGDTDPSYLYGITDALGDTRHRRLAASSFRSWPMLPRIQISRVFLSRRLQPSPNLSTWAMMSFMAYRKRGGPALRLSDLLR
jgi:hypothetical protein